MRIARRHESAAHHGIFRTNGDIRCAATRARQIVCPICRRSNGTAGKSSAYELCTEVGSASLYCTNSKRGYRRPGWWGSILPDRQREPQAPPGDDNTGQGEHEAERAEPDDQDVAQTRMCDEDRKVERMQPAIKPAISPPRRIQSLQDVAVGTVDVKPQIAAARAVDGCTWNAGSRGVVVVLGKNGRRAAARGETRRQFLNVASAQKSRLSIARRVPCLDQGLAAKANPIAPIDNAVEDEPFDFAG